MFFWFFNWRIGATYSLSREPTPKIYMMIVDGNKHSFAFAFAGLLKIRLEFVVHEDGNMASDVWTKMILLSAHIYQCDYKDGPISSQIDLILR